MTEKIGAVIIGAGVVGAGVAYALRDFADDVFVVDAGPRAGTGITSRNSGVVHAGLYYPPDSLKMALCRRGADLLYPFAAKHKIPCLRTGKYIVANNAEELAYLDWLMANVGDDGRLRDAERVPSGVRAERALFSPNTGIIDIHAFVEALLEQSGATLLFEQRVASLEAVDNGVRLDINGESYLAERVVNCAGLQAAGLAGRRCYFARGAYFRVHIPNHVDAPHLVYPAVPKGSPSLGVHLTRNVYGEAYLGPDIEWIDDEDYAVDESRREGFYRAAKTYLPWLSPDHLQPGYAGIRPKLAPRGFCDFVFDRAGARGQLIHCLGIESPGITASMAIGEHVARLTGLRDS